ncbi:hypothetical protein RBSWK_03440 [Rhodopirellula baltica SWK14]|uniref:Uncharacterized protein n=1 Tax=Rhodopirellula baltica SWK14 TaxID=993516 RepID=L7CED5_RHOBT|nr:hypothetical protein RBSWK_03440 [Rhodopirellula baltica SWK14]
MYVSEWNLLFIASAMNAQQIQLEFKTPIELGDFNQRSSPG